MTRAVTPADGKFAALHAALWDYGVFVHVPRNTDRRSCRLQVVCYNTSDRRWLLAMFWSFWKKMHRQRCRWNTHRVPTHQQSAYIGATELIVGDASNLRYVSLQDWNRETFEFSHQRGVVGCDAQLDWVNGVMGSRLTKAFIEVDAVGTGANARVSGFFFADQDQFFDLDTQQNHNAALTYTDLLVQRSGT